MSRGMNISFCLGGLAATAVFMNPQYYHLDDGQRIAQALIAGFAVFIFCIVSWLLINLIKSGSNKAMEMHDKAKEIHNEAFVVREEKPRDIINNKENKTMLQNWYNSMTPMQVKFLWIVSFLLVFLYGIGLIPLALLIYLKLGNQRV